MTRNFTIGRIGRPAALAALLGLLTGCVPQLSLQPLYTNDTLVFEPKLVGTWLEESGDGVYLFEPGDEKSYRLTMVTREGGQYKSSTYAAHLVRLGSENYLDLQPGEGAYVGVLDTEDLMSLLLAHVICRLQWEGESLRITFLKDEWVERMVREGRAELSHIEIKGGVVLTGAPQELQELLEKYAKDETAYGQVENYERSTEAIGQYFVARACSDKRQYDCAIAAYRKALAAAPAYADAYKGLGDTYLLAGRYAEAIAAYNKALEYNVGEEGTQRALEEAQAMAAVRPWQVKHVSGDTPFELESPVLLSVSPRSIRCQDDQGRTVSIPASQLTEVTYDQQVSSQAGPWLRGAAEAGVYLQPQLALPALVGAGIAAPFKKGKHFVTLFWQEGGQKLGVTFEVRKQDYQALLAEFERVGGRPPRNLFLERAVLHAELDREKDRKASLELTQDARVGNNLLQRGRYQIVLLERESGRGELYFFRGQKVNPKKVAATAAVTIEPYTGNSSTAQVRYQETDGVAVIAEIRAGGKTLRLQ